MAFLLRFVPYVRMVGLNGSMVTGRVRLQSDIDFFVVIKRGRIFIGRFLVVMVVQLLGLRPNKRTTAGKICLNRFASRSFLKITPENRYHARVFHNLIPLFSTGGCYEQYLESNRWMERFSLPVAENAVIWPDTGILKLWRGLLEKPLNWLGDPLEFWLFRWQSRHLADLAEAAEEQKANSILVVNEREIRFHLVKK